MSIEANADENYTIGKIRRKWTMLEYIGVLVNKKNNVVDFPQYQNERKKSR